MPTFSKVDMMNCCRGWHDFSDDATECHVCGAAEDEASAPNATALAKHHGMKPETSRSMEKAFGVSDRLYNCCTRHEAPDWSQFTQLELAGCRDESETPDETCTVGLQSASTAEFFTVYGRFPEPDGTCEAITDITDALDALAVAGELARISGLPVIVHHSLAED